MMMKIVGSALGMRVRFGPDDCRGRLRIPADLPLELPMIRSALGRREYLLTTMKIHTRCFAVTREWA